MEKEQNLHLACNYYGIHPINNFMNLIINTVLVAKGIIHYAYLINKISYFKCLYVCQRLKLLCLWNFGKSHYSNMKCIYT